MGKERPSTRDILHRTMAIEYDATATRAEGDTGIPIAISSEMPVERWFGTEILRHDAAAIDLSRAERGLPLLMDHDTGTHIGIVRDIALGPDKVLRGRMHFGNHPDAAWVRQDVLDGIRTEISVGYRINAWDDTRAEEEVYTASSWTPMEVSSVPVPADASVGVGRSADNGALAAGHQGTIATPAQPEMEGRMSDASPPAVPGNAGRTAEEIRKEILTIYSMAAEHGLTPADAAKAVERGISADRFAGEILDRNIGAAKATPVIGVDMEEKDHAKYNVARAILASASKDWSKAGLEREVSRTLSGGSDVGPNGGIMIPLNARASVTGQIVATSSLGGAGVQTSILSLIDILRNKAKVLSLGATFLPGLSSNITFPRQITANSLTWVTENPSTANTLSQMTFDTVALVPNIASAATAYSRLLLAQASFDASAVVMSDLAQVIAVGLDYAALNGTGTEQPTGIRGQTGITNKTMGTHGLALDWAAVVSAETSVSTANADVGSIAWLMNPATRGKLKTTLQNTTSGAGYIFGADGKVNGYPVEVTNQLPSNLTKGTNTTVCSTAVFGVWSELLIAQWGQGVEIVVDPYSYVNQNMIQVVSFIMADVGVKHPLAFVKIDDILNG